MLGVISVAFLLFLAMSLNPLFVEALKLFSGAEVNEMRDFDLLDLSIFSVEEYFLVDRASAVFVVEGESVGDGSIVLVGDDDFVVDVDSIGFVIVAELAG